MGTDQSILTMRHSDAQSIDTLARTLWGEARGEGPKGLRAVAHVVMNRVRLAQSKGGSWWGHDIITVCRKPYQFSCWNLSDLNRARVLAVTEHDPQFRQARAIATRVVTGLDTFDVTRGATHYHRYDMLPKWARQQVPTCRIGDHLFYDLSEEV